MKQNRHLYIGIQLTFYNVAKTIQRRKELLLTNNAVTIGYLKKKTLTSYTNINSITWIEVENKH